MKLHHLFILLFSMSLSAQSDYDAAQKLFNQKKYTESKQLLELYVKSHPNHYPAIETLGDIAGQQKKWTEAIKQYQILKNAFPKNANAKCPMSKAPTPVDPAQLEELHIEIKK